jgi:hypothetical protein
VGATGERCTGRGTRMEEGSCGEAARKRRVCLLAHVTVVPNTQPTPMENAAANVPTPS